MAVDVTTYFSLFVVSFLSATLLPLQSEGMLAALVALKNLPLIGLLFVATLGNVLGSVVTWWIGGTLNRWKNATWFPFSEASLQRGEAWFNRFGVWSLLFAWFPVVGDALCVAAGILKVRLLPFIVLVTIGKFARYALIVLVAAQIW